jgi:beta-glucanase (GH16 family)
MIFYNIYLLFISILVIDGELLCPDLDSSMRSSDSSSRKSWKLVWYDEFMYQGRPDPSKWGYDIGGGGWGNDELEYYTDNLDNAYVEDGNLIIVAKKEETYDAYNYTSARLVTSNKGDWTYGRFYIRAKLPNVHGNGTWPAIWMLPTDWEGEVWPNVGELDIMEQVSYDPQVIHGSIHCHDYNWPNGTQVTEVIEVKTATEEYHVYAMEWNEQEIKYYVDNQNYFIFKNNQNGTDSWPFTHDFHLLLNIAVGGLWGGDYGVDDAIFPAKMYIDYVRVCQ